MNFRSQCITIELEKKIRFHSANALTVIHNGRVQAGKAANLLAKRLNMNWFLLLDPTNHVQPLGEQAS